MTAYLDVPGLRLSSDGAPEPDVVIVDVADEDGVGCARAGRIVIGVARRALSARERAVAKELTCTLVPAGLDDAPFLVGVAEPAAAAAEIEAAVRAAPRASSALVTLLRFTSQLSVPDGLAAESAVYSMLLAGSEFGRWLAGHARPAPAAEGDPAVLTERAGNVLYVVLDRPDRRNAFDRFMRDALVDAFDIALADPSIERVVLSASGPAFCSGGDLAEFGTSADVSTAHLIRLDRSVAARLDRCHDRVVAHVHGACVGAGIEIPAFAGRIVARPETFFQLPELAMGLIPGAGGTVGITRRVGRWRTAYLALTGTRLDAASALDWGLVDAIVD